MEAERWSNGVAHHNPSWLRKPSVESSLSQGEPSGRSLVTDRAAAAENSLRLPRLFGISENLALVIDIQRSINIDSCPQVACSGVIPKALARITWVLEGSFRGVDFLPLDSDEDVGDRELLNGSQQSRSMSRRWKFPHSNGRNSPSLQKVWLISVASA
jgi:hypothetical protein